MSCRTPLGVSITAISDTHGRHNDMEPVPPADLLVHAGDFTRFGREGDLHSVKEYLDGQRARFKAIVVVDGNHESNAEWRATTKATLEAGNEDCEPDAAKIHFLRDESVEVTVTGGELANGEPKRLRIWGTEFYWPMRRARPEPSVWERLRGRGVGERCFDPNPNFDPIPKQGEVDVLVTHGPVRGRVDGGMGCGDLAWRVRNEIMPRAVVSGHIHHARGLVQEGGITFVNAAICGEKGYKVSHSAMKFEI